MNFNFMKSENAKAKTPMMALFRSLRTCAVGIVGIDLLAQACPIVSFLFNSVGVLHALLCSIPNLINKCIEFDEIDTLLNLDAQASLPRFPSS